MTTSGPLVATRRNRARHSAVEICLRTLRAWGPDGRTSPGKNESAVRLEYQHYAHGARHAVRLLRGLSGARAQGDRRAAVQRGDGVRVPAGSAARGEVSRRLAGPPEGGRAARESR